MIKFFSKGQIGSTFMGPLASEITFAKKKHLCPEMQAVTKMADLTKFRQTDVGQSDDFYANYITRDGVNVLANLTNLAIFMQITS